MSGSSPGHRDALKGRLAIIAGRGFLPRHLAEAARAAGENPLVILLRNEAEERFESFDAVPMGIADMAAFSNILKTYGIDRVVLSGGVKRRPDWRDIRPTWKTLRTVPKIVRALVAGGDDALLQVAIGVMEAQGCRVIGAHEIAPGLLAKAGSLGAHAASDDDLRDIAKASEAARRLGELDIGQGAVSVGGRVVALEGVEGTDSMLERVAALRAEGRISQRRKGVIVKLCKPQQDMRADLPTIGPSTVENAVRAGLAGIAVEAGRALVLEEEKVVAAANAAGIFVYGIDPGLKDGLRQEESSWASL
ncbi:LpxI family protein [Rhizobium sp. XQZ8]|uniref:LpxI family protein n=1 Tax=Rhizobium populisoli TaxID=2859785 RepID=UPI001C67ECD6|nr:LpxI family protein [Rhizobium populisoli]MBW6420059.1 LpxI family protein [Rhizobium populisoli]